jgi:hypothetical protein
MYTYCSVTLHLVAICGKNVRRLGSPALFRYDARGHEVFAIRMDFDEAVLSAKELVPDTRFDAWNRAICSHAPRAGKAEE